ncbi:MAG: hypothetical protein RL660_3128 [Bacteroidota bacterium]|jgi:hypothetical protein
MLASMQSFAQAKYTLSGTITSGKTGEIIIGATITVQEIPSLVATSNEYGFYSISLPQGTYNFKVNYIGHKEATQTIVLDSNTVVKWKLLDNKGALTELKVSTKKKNDNLTKAVMGTETLNMREVAKLPVIFGEKDILKTITLLPGVKSSGEGGNGFSVRGGATDQNLILLDEAPVYNASHLLGFFSTFNSDAIKDATIIKGNSPANYGGRLSSVLDVKMKDGNNKDYNVSGGLGIISSRLTVEGPIQKDKSSFIISGRRSYADLFLKLTEDFKDTKLFFYDLNAKANFTVNSKNKIYASGYFGRDVLGIGGNFGTDWGNATGTLRWNSVINSKLFSNTSFIYSNYSNNINITANENDFNINSKITDWNLRQDFSYYANPKNSLRFGFQSIYHVITPSRFTGTQSSETINTGRHSLENAVYINNNYKATSKLTVDYGLRATGYTMLGANTYNIYEGERLTDSVVLDKGEAGKTYYTFEPRITSNLRLTDAISIKAGYARNGQHLHLLSNSTSGNPTDQWIGNSYNIKPEIADQFSIGYSQNFSDNNYELGIESYYKKMQNQVDYKNGADLQSTADVESQLLYGQGRAYGLELIFKKKAGNFTGWASYTLSKTERQIEGINNGEWYNAKQDRTHDLSLVGIYQLAQRWSLSGLFIYTTGNATTYPTGKYIVNGNVVYQYSSRNADRLPATHRLDLSATYDFKKRGKYESSLNFGVYNAYGRQNPYTITFSQNETDPSKTDATQTSLFRWVPSVTYNFKF